MEPLTSIVLVGAAGTVGSNILNALVADPSFNITILTRPDSKSSFPSSQSNIKILRCDYDLPSLISAFQSQDAVICAIAVQAIATQTILIQAAEKAGVRRFILNEFANSPTNQIGLPEFRNFSATVTKQEMVTLVKTLAAANSNFTWSALATGNFIDLSLRKYPPFGFDLARKTARLIDDGTEPITAVTLEDIGIAVRGILRSPESTANKYLHIRSTETTQKQILHALEEQTGETWETTYASSRELYAVGKEKFERGERRAC